MKYIFLALGVLCLLSTWNAGKDLAHDFSRKLLHPASEVERFSAVVALIMVSASLLGALICAVGYTVHLRLDAIELRLGAH